MLQILVALKSYVVSEADGGKGDDAVVEGVKVRPSLNPREGVRTACHHDARHVDAHENEIRLRNLARLETKAFLEVSQHKGHEDIQAFSNALEHDEVERDADQGVKHAKNFSSHRLRRAVAETLVCGCIDFNEF